MSSVVRLAKTVLPAFAFATALVLLVSGNWSTDCVVDGYELTGLDCPDTFPRGVKLIGLLLVLAVSGAILLVQRSRRRAR